MHVLKAYFSDSNDYQGVKALALQALKKSAVAVETEKFLLIDGSITDSEKEILVSEARTAGKTILINENEGDDDEEDLLH